MEGLNPFRPKDPAPPEYFYGRDSIINRYKGNLRQDDPINLLLVGDWGIGKTSTLLKLQSLEIDDLSVAKIHLPLTHEEEDNFEKFVYSLLKESRRNLRRFNFDWEITQLNFEFLTIEKGARPDDPKDVFLDKMTDIWNKASSRYDRVVIYLDDFDLMYNQQMSVRNCFQELRRQGCKFMLVGTCTPDIIGFSDLDEPFSRFFDIRDLHVFQKEDSIGMVRHVLDKSQLDVSVTDDVLELLHEETGGHPYHLTLFMHEILRNRNEGMISIEDYQGAEPEIMRGFNTHLKQKFSDLTENEGLAIQCAINAGEAVFRPSDLDDLSNPSDVCLNLCDKEVFERKGRGQYTFKHPMTRKYFESEFLIES